MTRPLRLTDLARAAGAAILILLTCSAMAQAQDMTTTTYPYTYTNPGGTTTVIAAKPTRVVVVGFGGGGMDLVTSNGGNVVGDTPDAGVPQFNAAGFPGWLNGGELNGITSVGLETSPNYEEIAALDPDLIVAQSTLSSSILSQLQAIAPVAQFSTTTGGPSNTNPFVGQYVWEYNLLALAPVFNDVAHAEQIIARLHQRLAALEPFADGISVATLEPLKSTFDLITSDQNNGAFFQLIGANVESNLAGATFTSGDLFDEASNELLNEVTATKVLVTSMGQITQAQFEAEPLYSQIPAVATGQIYYTNWLGAGGPVASADFATQMAKEMYGIFPLEAVLAGTGKDKASSAVDDVDVSSSADKACWALSTTAMVGKPSAVEVENAKTGKELFALGLGSQSVGVDDRDHAGCKTVSRSEAEQITASPDNYKVAIEGKSTIEKTVTKHGKRVKRKVKTTVALAQGALGNDSPAFFGNGHDTQLDQ